MSVWEENDKNGFNQVSLKNMGQISINSLLGSFLYNCSIDTKFTNYLEIGTWNGMGSTRCFTEGFKNRKTPFKFFSLECNKDKSDFARNLYKDLNDVNILNEVLLNDMPNDIYDIFPELNSNKDYQYWNNIDFENMKDKPLFLKRNDIPDFFDLILLDGGEFTTWYEYLLIKDKCKILVLDDANTNKCKKIKEEIKKSEEWDIIFDLDERNGIFACKRKNF